MIILFLTFMAFVSAVISGLVGMAGGITLLAAMTLVAMPIEAIVPIHGLVQLTSNFSRTFFLLKNVRWKIVGHFAVAVPLGGYGGYYLLSRMDRPEWILALIAGTLLYAVFKPKKFPELRIPFWSFSFLGGVAALLGCLIGATGPLIAPFFVRSDLSKEEMVATKAATQITVHLVKIPVFWALSFNYAEHIQVILFMVVAVIAGTKVGTLLLKKMSAEQFMKILKAVMLVIAVRLLWKTFFS